MGFTGGRGGLLTVLLGLFTLTVIFLAEMVKWLIIGTTIAVVLTYRGIRWLYRRYRRRREIHADPFKVDPRSIGVDTEFSEPPKPHMSPVETREYPDNDWS